MNKTRTIHFAVFMICALLSAPAAVCIADEAVNPHWTGAHCMECHTSDNRTLRESGDIIALCNRCHNENAAPMETHPFGMAPSEDIRNNIPSAWPLQDETVTCITCHDALVQMYRNPAARAADSAFVRGEPRDTLSGFCFVCHRKESFRKTNPHRSQRDESGGINRDACLFCHRSVPDPERVKNTGGVTFIAGRSELCIDCHADKRAAHPARENHLLSIGRDRSSAIANAAASAGIDLPVHSGAISCGTCHNPHEPGIISRKAAAAGAGEDKMLRHPAGTEICTACHPDRALPEKYAVPQEKNVLKAPPQPLIPHEPWQKNRCKSCHSITPQQTGMPDAPQLCMKKGCHEAGMYEREHLHDVSVLSNCYFCHESHSAHYGRLLRSNEERICYSCHPLVPKALKAEGGPSITAEDHDRIAGYISFAGSAQDRGCSFCHEAAHESQIAVMKTGSCADCHIYITRIVQRYAEDGVHAAPARDRCSQCHDPHAEKHRFQLKQPPDSYLYN